MRVRIFCECQVLVHKNNILLLNLRLSQGKTQWRETGWPPNDVCTVSCYSYYCGSEFMVTATERRETELAGLGRTNEILKLKLRHVTDTQADYYVSRHRITCIGGEVRVVVRGKTLL